MGEDELHLCRSRMPRAHDFLDRRRQQRVVGVEEYHDAAAARAEAGIEGGGVAAVGLEDRSYLIAIARNHVARVVGRTVVDDYYFDLRITLRERAVDRGTEEPRGVEIVDYDANEGLELCRLRRLHRQVSGGRSDVCGVVVELAMRDVLPAR